MWGRGGGGVGSGCRPIYFPPLQAYCLAYNVEVDMERMADWTVAAAKNYFSSGGLSTELDRGGTPSSLPTVAVAG